MLRRKLSTDPAQYPITSSSSSPQVPLGGDTNITTPVRHNNSRRKRKKHPSCFRSCLVSLRIVSDRKTIDSLSGKPKRGGGGDRILPLLCVVVSSLLCFLMVTTGMYTAVVGTDGGNLILITATTNIDSDLIRSALLELRPTGDLEEDLPIVFFQRDKKYKNKKKHDPHFLEADGEFYYPSELGHKEEKQGDYVDFGDIDLRLLTNDDQKRQIYIMVEDLQGDARSLDQERDDDYEIYWNFDDDKERNPYLLFNQYEKSMEGRCRRTSWHRNVYPVCNNMHELDLLTNTPRFVGDGAYREVFVTEQPYMESIEEMIFKELRWDLDMAYDDFEYIRMDALVTERFTSNDMIVDIYGHCGLSMLTEYFAHGDIEDDVVGFKHHRKDFNPLEDEELNPLNNFTGSEKLKLALDMVKPVMALHNFKDGVIVHDDIQLCQYLWTDETKSAVKLNDFNRAEIMLWDEQDQKYCKYKNGRGHGDWRAPEEYKDFPLDETIDIWSLGNNFYSLLTGVYPFFNVEKDKDIQKRVKGGDIAKIDPRYSELYAEEKLARIIVKMWSYYPAERPTAGELLQMLEDAIVKNEQWEKEEPQRLAEKETREKEEAQKRAKAEKAEEVAHDLADEVQHAQEDAVKELSKDQELTADLAHHAEMKKRAGEHETHPIPDHDIAGGAAPKTAQKPGEPDHQAGAVVADPVA